MAGDAIGDADGAWLATLTVLCVEDDETARAVLARFLRRRVARVVEAADGAEGLERFAAERPAIVITDLRMPRLDGLAMATEIRRLDARVPLVVTTAFEEIGYLRRAIDAGVDHYVTKPIDTGKLEAALLTVARRLRAEARLAAERERELDALRSHEREAVGLLAGGMAHDFNNLLQTVLGATSLAAEQAAPGSDQRELLDAAVLAAQQAAALGHELLTLSGRGFARVRPLPLGPTVREALAHALAGSATRLHLELAKELPVVLHDPERLGRALRHVVKNAREAMADGGELWVTGEERDLDDGEASPLPAGRYVVLTVRDAGPGVAPALLPRLFDAYFSTKPRGAARGLGLGLALCRAIVVRHGGSVAAASPPGGGAVLTLRLPVLGAPGAT